MTRTTWSIIACSLFNLASGGMLFAADPQSIGFGDRGRDGGSNQEEGIGIRGRVDLPRVNVQAPQVQLPNVQAPKVETPRGPAIRGEARDVPVPKAQRPNVPLPNAQVPSDQVPNVRTPNARVPNVQAPNVQAPNVQGPRVNRNQINPSQPGRQVTPNGAARVPPPSGNVDAQGRARGSVGTEIGIPGAGIQVGPRVGANIGARVDDRVLGGTSINLGNRQLNIAGGNYRPSHHRHPWFGGYWNFNNWRGGGWNQNWNGGGWGYGGWGSRSGYWGRPFGWGLGAWGLGSLNYNSGYLAYSNPYYGGGAAYDYSQPIPVSYYTDTNANDPTEEMLNAAIAAFRRTEYDAALSLIDRAISRHPDDAVLHEFRALVLFAKADYRQAAATIHSVLAIGPGWDWTTMSRLYSDVAVYTAQLRALEFYTKEHTNDAAGLFLLAYHYLCTAHPDAAARKLQDVVQLEPTDRVAADLLKLISSGSNGPTTTSASPPAPPQPAPQPVPQPPATPATPQTPAEAPRSAGKTMDKAAFAGTWKAERSDGSKFELRLNPDSTFTWTFSQKNNEEKFSGTYTLEGTVLALQRKEGGSLVGNITPMGEGRFNFKLLGGPPEDTGLEFAR